MRPEAPAAAAHLNAPPPGTDGVARRRGYRRVQWIEQVVEPLRERLSTEPFGRLVPAIAVVMGWNAVIVLRDTRSLPDPRSKRSRGGRPRTDRRQRTEA